MWDQCFAGVALDGFPIYGPYASDKGSDPLTSDDLDICHGRMVDGKYRYHLTYDFPYVLGCYWGASAKDNAPQVSYDCDLDSGTGENWETTFIYYRKYFKNTIVLKKNILKFIYFGGFF